MKRFSPMLCKKGNRSLLGSKEFWFEPKLDGSRAMLYFEKGKIQIINRRGRRVEYRYPEFDFTFIARECVLDGEIVVYDKEGMPDFNLLQKREIDDRIKISLRSDRYPATFVVFDILYFNGQNLQILPIEKRRRYLKRAVKGGQFLELCFFCDEGKKLWRIIEKKNIEGIIAKKKKSNYQVGTRSSDWLKIKKYGGVDAIIIGYTCGKREVSALLLALRKGRKLFYIGKVGTGFSKEESREILEKSVKTNKRPAGLMLRGFGQKVQWVEPKQVAKIRYLELTKNNELRSPVFIGLRDDKKPNQCLLSQLEL